MLNWIKDTDEDAEYNQHLHMKNAHTYILYSDRDGENWTIEFPDSTTTDLDAGTFFEAKQEAEKLIREWEHG